MLPLCGLVHGSSLCKLHCMMPCLDHAEGSATWAEHMYVLGDMHSDAANLQWHEIYIYQSMAACLVVFVCSFGLHVIVSMPC